ncbi:hypothetical protein, partial [Nonomuraea sp. SBT364]|uniref:hypothetical protein n=1 Tax=Nonomuraea sp. SBT364 TaxID=1580530 RepID=UPI001E3D1D45
SHVPPGTALHNRRPPSRANNRPFIAPTAAEGGVGEVVGIGAMNGRLFALDGGRRLWSAVPGGTWERLEVTVPGTAFAAHAGTLVAAGRDLPLRLLRWDRTTPGPPR